MKCTIKSLTGYQMGATDGDIGKVKDFYFHDDTWMVRYVIVETGNWLNGRKVLISTQALLLPDPDNKLLPINLTKEQIENSPDIDTDKPVSRQQELKLYDHYPWQTYWGGGLYAGNVWSIIQSDAIDNTLSEAPDGNSGHSDDDPRLRSTADITGYNIHATDGDIGHVNDFIVDDKTWKLLYFVVDTHNWIGGMKVLIPVHHVKEVQWDNSKVIVNITMDEVKNSRYFQKSDFVHSHHTNTSLANGPG